MRDVPAGSPPVCRGLGRSELCVHEGDITRVPADAIVNAANSAFAHGSGVDGALRPASGPELSGEMRRRYASGTPTGTAVATGASALPARWAIHAVGPVWGQGDLDKLELLASAYRRALQVAEELAARTVAAPAISAGTFGFPLEVAADVALRTSREFLLGGTGVERVTSCSGRMASTCSGVGWRRTLTFAPDTLKLDAEEPRQGHLPVLSDP